MSKYAKYYAEHKNENEFKLKKSLKSKRYYQKYRLEFIADRKLENNSLDYFSILKKLQEIL